MRVGLECGRIFALLRVRSVESRTGYGLPPFGSVANPGRSLASFIGYGSVVVSCLRCVERARLIAMKARGVSEEFPFLLFRLIPFLAIM